MDSYSFPNHPTQLHKRASMQNPQLFDDTSMSGTPGGSGGGGFQQQPQQSYMPSQDVGYGQGGYGNDYGQGNFQFSGQQLLNDPMASMAMSYGQNVADQGKAYLNKNIEKYVSSSKLKYYFAVDTAYVGKKLALLLFPYAHSDWSIHYNQDMPIAPRYEVNAPDLYIPVMSFVTYVLMAGIVLGTQDRFTPEQLGITSTTALVWLVIEILALLLATYFLRVSAQLQYLDLLAYCGYKYVGMIVTLFGDLLFGLTGYYATLLWTSAALAFFLVRALKCAIVPHTDTANAAGFQHSGDAGGKRRLYALLVIALLQPIFMWWLTIHLAV